MQRPILDIHGGCPVPAILSRTDALLRNSPFLRKNGLVRGKVADDTACRKIDAIGGAKGKGTSFISGDCNGIATIAPAQISAIMRDATLSAAEKQRGAQALRAGQQPASEASLSVEKREALVTSKLAETCAAWSLDKPPLHVDRRGLPMWPRSNKLNKPSNSVVCESQLERVPSVPSPWTSDSEDSMDDCERRTGAALLFFARSPSAASEPFPARSASLTWARSSLALHESKATQPKSFVPDNQGLETEEREISYAALLQKVSKLETEKAVLKMQMEMLKADCVAENARNQAEIAQVKATANAEIDHVKAKADKSSEASKMELIALMKIIGDLKTHAEGAQLNFVDKISAHDDGGQQEDVLSDISTRPSTPRTSCLPTTLQHLNLGWESLEEEDPYLTPLKPFMRLQAEGLDSVDEKNKEHDDHKQELQRVEELNVHLLQLVTTTSLDFLPYDWTFLQHDPHCHTKQSRSHFTEDSLSETLQQGLDWHEFKATMRERIDFKKSPLQVSLLY